MENKRDPEENPRSLYPVRFALAPAGVPGLGASPGVWAKKKNRRILKEFGGLSKKQKLEQVGCELGNHCARCDHGNIYRFRTDVAQRLGITHAVEHDNLRALMSEFSCGFLEFFFRGRVT